MEQKLFTYPTAFTDKVFGICDATLLSKLDTTQNFGFQFLNTQLTSTTVCTQDFHSTSSNAKYMSASFVIFGV